VRDVTRGIPRRGDFDQDWTIMPAARTAEQSAQRADRRALLVATGGVLSLLAVGAALLVSNAYQYAPAGVGGGSFGSRLAANTICVLVMLAVLRGRWRLRLLECRARRRAAVRRSVPRLPDLRQL
jgi:hypothetical protein